MPIKKLKILKKRGLLRPRKCKGMTFWEGKKPGVTGD